MENPQEFLDKNLEELKALQIGEVKVIDGVRLKGETSNSCCDGCIFRDCNCESTADDCSFKAWDFVIVEVDENDNLKNKIEWDG